MKRRLHRLLPAALLAALLGAQAADPPPPGPTYRIVSPDGKVTYSDRQPTDPQWLSTLKVIGEKLVDDSLVHRYDHGDGTGSPESAHEGTFNMCTFWYAECLARGGDPLQGRYIFEKMLGYANHLGLFAEELGPAGDHLGNFPQAFTHLALINAAYYLDRALSGHDGRE